MDQESRTPADQEPQEGTEPAQEATPEGTTYDESYVKKLRAENAEHRRKARDAEERLQAIEDAEKSELEKATNRADEAEKARDEAVSRANQTLIRSAVVEAAVRQGAVDPDAVVRLIESDAVTIVDGAVDGADQAVQSLLEAKPYLAGVLGKPAAGPSGGGIQEDPKDGKRTPDEWKELLSSDPKKFADLRAAGEVPHDAFSG